MFFQNHNNSICIIILDFAEDLERLGRANGNIFARKPGVPNLHDGQIMVRLKKKRFILLDYSLIPTTADIALASVTPHLLCPNGAGKQKCIQPECTKVGVPVLLFDSDPEQPTSLYLRSGLCFTCQRILNEKRRTQRKRKSEPGGTQASAGGMPTPEAYTSQKRFRLAGEILDLNPDAIIINGPLDGTKHHGPGYEYREIGSDLQTITSDVSHETNALSRAVTAAEPLRSVSPEDHTSILALYEKTFLSMSKGIFLLSQWKSSWDACVAAAAAEKQASEQQVMLDGTSILATAVASAAAVAAAQQSTPEAQQHSQNPMIPLLLSTNKDDIGVNGADASSVDVVKKEVVENAGLQGVGEPSVEEKEEEENPEQQIFGVQV